MRKNFYNGNDKRTSNKSQPLFFFWVHRTCRVHFIPFFPSYMHVFPIDISWLDWAYKSSTCDVKFRNTIWPPTPQLSLHRRAALSSYSNGTRSVYSRENPKSSLYCEMSVVFPHKRRCTVENTWFGNAGRGGRQYQGTVLPPLIFLKPLAITK
jgi:hypothetical protein